MNKKIALATLIASAFILTGCGNNPSKEENHENETAQTARKILKASLSEDIVESGEKASVITNVEGVTYRSSDENIATIGADGSITTKNPGMAHITVSKEGYFDRVLKLFVEQYDTIDYLVEGFEYGPAIVAVKLNFPDKVSKEDLIGKEWSVKTNKTARTVERVDLCDVEGQIIDDDESNYVRISLVTQSNEWGATGGAACFTYANSINNWTTGITVEATLANGHTLEVGDKTYDSTTKFNTLRSRIILSTKDWGEAKKNTAEGYTLTYKGYETDEMREDGVLNPLIIWLHGQGEGGTDPDIALVGNDVTALGEPTIQSHFKKGDQKGAYILAVQTPTMWMDDGHGNNNDGLARSIYTASLKAAIDNYIEENGDVDTNRIFLGGCSNGGYMTMDMAITYGDFFRAYYPTCEAFSDSIVTDEHIESLKDLSMWFIHASNDTTVNPKNFTIPTYQRLARAGAEDLHFSYFTDVRGTDGNAKGNSYLGHYSWIYIFRDEVSMDQADPENITVPSNAPVKDADGNNINLFDWMENMK